MADDPISRLPQLYNSYWVALPRRCNVHICGRGSCFTCSAVSPFQNPHPLNHGRVRLDRR